MALGNDTAQTRPCRGLRFFTTKTTTHTAYDCVYRMEGQIRHFGDELLHFTWMLRRRVHF